MDRNKLRLGLMNFVTLTMLTLAMPASARVQLEALLYYKVEGTPPNEKLVLDQEQSFESNCVQQIHPGCVNVPKYKNGVIAFILPGSDRECADDADQWKLTNVLLGGASRLSKPLPKPVSWGDLNGPDGVRAASNFGADRDSGETRYHKRKRFPESLFILDSNTYLVSAWYQIVATHCSDPRRTATAEGRIDNRGR
jgi:hypothetical protein